MKIILKSIVLFVSFVFLSSCEDEKVIEVKPDFEVTYKLGSNYVVTKAATIDMFAGTTMYVVKTGSGEFNTVFDGTAGSVWGEGVPKGVNFNKSDSLPITYEKNGTYKLTLVSTSAAEFGNKVVREIKEVVVNVIDVRNSITSFKIQVIDAEMEKIIGSSISGKFSNDSILFTFPDVVTNFYFKRIFSLDSQDAVAKLNDVTQVSAADSINFVTGLIGTEVNYPYVVTAHHGEVKTYNVNFKVVASSPLKALTKVNISYGGNNEFATFDDGNHIVNLALNAATSLTTKKKLIIEASPFSVVWMEVTGAATQYTKYNAATFYYLSGATKLKSIKVIAQDKSEQIYTLNITQ